MSAFLIVIQTDFGRNHILVVSLIAAFLIIVFAITNCILTENNKEKYYKDEYRLIIASYRRYGVKKAIEGKLKKCITVVRYY